MQPSLAYFSTRIWDCEGVGVWQGAVAGRQKVWVGLLTLLLPESLRLLPERLLMCCAAQIWVQLNRSAAAKPMGWHVCGEAGPCREGRGPLRWHSIPVMLALGNPDTVRGANSPVHPPR